LQVKKGRKINIEISEGSLSGTNRFFRLYYNSIQKKWLKEDRSGTFVGNILYCSTKSDRTGRIFCGLATIGTAGGGTRYPQTSPPANLQNCINLGGSGNSTNVRGAAADPNLVGDSGRDVVYFAFANTDTSTYEIRKVSQDCSTIIKSNYGNANWYPNWNPLVGMAVDPANGDLYVAEPTQIKIVHPDETIEVFKTGFTSIYGIDVWREPGYSFGYLIVADSGASQVKAVALDNPSATPIVVSSASILRAVTIGWSTYATWAYNITDLIRLIILHNDGNTVPKLREEPFLYAEPYDSSAKIWISSPDATDIALHQGHLRPSVENSPEFSTIMLKAYWKDGKATQTLCAIMGDPRSSAPYEPAPSPIPDGCTHPWKNPSTGTIYAKCDNSEDFVVGGVGSPHGATDLLSCKSNCGVDKAHACIFEFQISQRYAGENYRIYFWVPDRPWIIKSATVTAWKRVFIEQDKMCRRGGMLWKVPNQEPDPKPGDIAILIAKYNTVRVDNLQLNDIIDIFDASQPYEGDHDKACVIGIDDTTDNRFVTITLGQVVGTTCTATNYPLVYGYHASVPNPLNSDWDFAIGESAGVCATAQGYFKADTSKLNKRDLTGPFDDAFVSFRDTNSGRSVLPYLHTDFFNDLLSYRIRFHQKWFANKNPKTCTIDGNCVGCCNYPHNYYHLIGASDSNAYGKSYEDSDNSYVFIMYIEDTVNLYCQSNPCSGNETNNSIRRTTSHEFAHQFRINSCDAGGHDTNNAWCGSPGGSCISSLAECNPNPPNPMVEWCLMNQTNAPFAAAVCQRINGIDRLDCSDLSAHQLCPEPDCTCPLPPCNPPLQDRVSIRTNKDPE
jgi:hypothetical protein